MINIFITKGRVYSKPIEYILSIFAKNISCPIQFSDNKSNAQLIFDHSDVNSEPINLWFFENLLSNNIYNHESYFKNGPHIIFSESEKIDYLGTAFYMINSFQEYHNDNSSNFSDSYGRFRYDKSYQYKFDCLEGNIVQRCFEYYYKEHNIFSRFTPSGQQTRVFLSHDIDTLYGSFLQDGLWAFKHRRLDVILKLIMNEILLRPDWRNIDKIVKLHSEYDLKSTFFWLATKKTGSNKVKNADYSIRKQKALLSKSQSNGLHKSCYNYTIDQELELMPFKTKLNRFHFLKFTIPESWDDLSNSKIELDASLGFAEKYGFRNNYGLPFRPFNLATQEPHSFVEVPLNVMDGTLHRYMKIPKPETAQKIISFLEKNNKNCIISILWHNAYFTNYKYDGYLKEYKKLLAYIIESGIRSVSPEEILKEFA